MSDTITKVMTGILLIVNTILTVFVCNMVFGLQKQVEGLGQVVTRADLINMTSPAMEMPFQEKCTRCHTERRFTELPVDEVHQAVLRMQQHPDADIDDTDIAKIQASLTLLKCSVCHSTDTIRNMAILSDEERITLIRDMQVKHGKIAIDQTEAEKILESYKVLFGM